MSDSEEDFSATMPLGAGGLMAAKFGGVIKDYFSDSDMDDDEDGEFGRAEDDAEPSGWANLDPGAAAKKDKASTLDKNGDKQ